MDYKINSIAKSVKCEDIALQDLPTLLFTDMEGTVVFDATEYCLANDLENFDYRVFSRINKCYIESLVKNTGLDKGKLFFMEKGGHTLIIQDLAFLFLAFVDPDICTYFNGILAEVMLNGIGFSDGFAVRLASQRISTDILKDIIKSRDDDQ